MKIKLPKEVRVGGHRYKIFLMPEEIRSGQYLWGEANLRTLEITISKDRIASQKREALIHEFLHIVDAVYSGLELTEKHTGQLARGLNQVFDGLDLDFDWSDIPTKEYTK